jgi:hypothetical protein
MRHPARPTAITILWLAALGSAWGAHPPIEPTTDEVDAALASHAARADSVVLRHGIAEHHYSAVACAPDEICLFGLQDFEIQITRTIAGPSIKGRVHALIIAETIVRPEYVGAFELFVLHPIEGTRLSKTSGTRYYLLSLSARDENDRYCLMMNPSEEGLAIPESQISTKDGSYCFPRTSLPTG